MTVRDIEAQDVALINSTDLVSMLIFKLIGQHDYDEGRNKLRESPDGIRYCHIEDAEIFFALDVGIENKQWLMRRLAKIKIPAILAYGVIFISGIEGKSSDKQKIAALINKAKNQL